MTIYRAKHPAAFINVIAEEGTKAEAVEWLQRTWDELCDLRQGHVVLERYQQERRAAQETKADETSGFVTQQEGREIAGLNDSCTCPVGWGPGCEVHGSGRKQS
jgi:hypothetical protein